MTRKEWTVEYVNDNQGNDVYFVLPADGIMPTTHYFYPSSTVDGRTGYGFISRMGADVAAEALNMHETGASRLTLIPITED